MARIVGVDIPNEKRVVVSRVTIKKMLEDNPKWTGIRVLRVVKH